MPHLAPTFNSVAEWRSRQPVLNLDAAMKIWLITLTCAIFLCACNEQTSDQEQIGQPGRVVSSDETVQQLISDGLLTLSLGFIKHYGPDGEVTIRCVADLVNHTDLELVLSDQRFRDYEHYVILDEQSQKPVETFANSSASLGNDSIPFVLGSWGEERIEIHYEAFTCFQGTSFPDGSVTYEPNGTFIMFHREFPNCRLRFEFSDQGLIKPILDMKEQDAP